MWQHWVNFILAILAVIFLYTAASTGLLAAISVLIIIFSLWGALATSSSGSGQRAHAT